jgi:uncharacterized protein YcfL
MKKVILSFGIVAAIALASCGNKQTCQQPQEAEVVVEEVVVVVSIAADSEEGAAEVVEGAAE